MNEIGEMYFPCHAIGHLMCIPKRAYTKSGLEKSKFYLIVRNGFSKKGEPIHYSVFTFLAYGKTAQHINKFYLRKDLVNISCHPVQFFSKNEEGKRTGCIYFVVDRMTLLARNDRTPLVFMGDGAPVPDLDDDDYTIIYK